MQGLQRRCSADLPHLDLLSPAATSLSIDAAEPAEDKIQRLISEHPVVIFTRSACYMCHVMKNLLSTVGVNPAVIELDDHEISALPAGTLPTDHPASPPACHITHPPPPPPAVFIGGSCVGGFESLVALHLSGHLVPRLVEVGALWV